MSSLQELIDNTRPTSTLSLTPPNGEFEGPVTFHRPIVLDGQGGTIWCQDGPVITVESGGVKLRNVNIEITGKPTDLDHRASCALVVKLGANPKLENVSVRGNVVGMHQEEGTWRYPRSLRLGKLACGQTHRFRVKLYAPVPCQLRSEIDGLAIDPHGVDAGPVEATIELDPLRPRTRLRGAIVVRSAFLTRRIQISGTATRDPSEEAKLGEGQVIWEPNDWETLSASTPSVPDETGSRRKKGRPKKKRRHQGRGTAPGDVPRHLAPEQKSKSQPPPAEVPGAFQSPKQETQADETKSRDSTAEGLKTPPSPRVSSVPVHALWSPTANVADEEAEFAKDETGTKDEKAGMPPAEPAGQDSETLGSADSETTPVESESLPKNGGPRQQKKRRKPRNSKRTLPAFSLEPDEQSDGSAENAAPPNSMDEQAADDESTDDKSPATDSTKPERKCKKTIKPDKTTGVFGRQQEQ